VVQGSVAGLHLAHRPVQQVTQGAFVRAQFSSAARVPGARRPLGARGALIVRRAADDPGAADAHRALDAHGLPGTRTRRLRRAPGAAEVTRADRKSTRLNSSHVKISY